MTHTVNCAFCTEPCSYRGLSTAPSYCKYKEQTAFSITEKEQQALWDREFDKYMDMPKRELIINYILGERPI